MDKIKLFCFPYAGGSAAVFNRWKLYLDNRIELRSVELAGRGKRIHEALYDSIPDVVEDVLRFVGKEIMESPYALFGHSLGSRVAYELAQKARDLALPAPLHIFFSGRSAPHIERPDEKIFHLMNEEDFKREVLALGGTAVELFEHPELMELFLPVLRNDFKLAETAGAHKVIRPFEQNITVFLGKDDDLVADECDGWKLHTTQRCTLHYFNGGHFFLNDEIEEIVRVINNTLCSNVARMTKH